MADTVNFMLCIFTITKNKWNVWKLRRDSPGKENGIKSFS